MLALLLLAVVPLEDVAPRDACALIECNQVVGTDVDQVIFWDRDDKYGYVVAGWKLAKHCTPPRYDQAARHWELSVWDGFAGNGGQRRIITAPAYRESQTWQDPEEVNRQVWPCDKRRPLWREPSLR